MRATSTLPLFPLQPPARHPVKRRAIATARALRPAVESAPLLRTRCRQLWVAIHLPQLALEAFEPSPQPSPASGRGSGALASSGGRGSEALAPSPLRGEGWGEGQPPIVVIDPEQRQQNVLAGNAAAYAAGVRPGQSLNAAIAFASQLEARPRNAAQEQERLARLAAWCQQFTPLVSLEPGNELLLEVKGSLALFEGARSLLQRLATGLREQGITAQLALAPTPRAALWLARALPSPQPSPAGGRGSEALAPSPLRGEGWGEGRIVEKPEALGRHLAPVPLRLLGWPEELFAQLTSLGLRTIGDLMRLPRSGMARRLGQARLDELDRALGRRADVRRGFRRPQRFDARRAPDHEIESAPGLAAACEPLLDELQAYLRERQAAIAVLALEIRHRSQPRTRLRIGLAAPSGDITHLRALLEERLASLSLPAPAIALRLHSGALLEQVPVAGNLKIEERAGACAPADALPRLLERLRARLGPEAVFGVSTVEDHRPECAWRTNDVPSPHPSSASGRGSGAPYDSADFRPLPPGERDGVRGAGRPLWLCAEPQWLSDKNPITRGRAPLELLSGPERIETGWWDGREVLRDYFVARDARGVRLWIYRDRCAPHGWYLHGLFG